MVDSVNYNMLVSYRFSLYSFHSKLLAPHYLYPFFNIHGFYHSFNFSVFFGRHIFFDTVVVTHMHGIRRLINLLGISISLLYTIIY